jgi:acetolactate synthase-1/2/3 large subunit
LRLVEQLQIPVAHTWNTIGIFADDHPLCIGRPGYIGQRGANLTVYECDYLLCIGTHLRHQHVGPVPEEFAPNAKIVTVHIDQEEYKHSRLEIHQHIHCDARAFLDQLGDLPNLQLQSWRERVLELKKLNAIRVQVTDSIDRIDLYDFMLEITKFFPAPIVVDGGGTVTQAAMQGLSVAAGQSVILSSGLTSMGSGLPEAIGRAFQTRKKTLSVWSETAACK